jgi:hypothetical protein
VIPYRRVIDNANPRNPHAHLLRARHERPSGYTAAEKRDEFPTPDGGTPRPRITRV